MRDSAGGGLGLLAQGEQRLQQLDRGLAGVAGQLLHEGGQVDHRDLGHDQLGGLGVVGLGLQRGHQLAHAGLGQPVGVGQHDVVGDLGAELAEQRQQQRLALVGQLRVAQAGAHLAQHPLATQRAEQEERPRGLALRGAAQLARQQRDAAVADRAHAGQGALAQLLGGRGCPSALDGFEAGGDLTQRPEGQQIGVHLK